MRLSNKKTLCIGEVLWDVFPNVRKPGGAPLNVAIHLSRLGHKVQMSSRIGDDDHGISLLEFITKHGIRPDHIQVDPKLPTSEVLVSLDEKSNATFEIPEPVAWDNLAYSTKLDKAADKAGVIIYGTLGSRNAVARGTIKKVLNSKALKVIDVNLRPPYTESSIVKDLLFLADIAKLNEEELVTITEWDGKTANNAPELIEWLAERYQLKMVVVTRGEEGAIIYDSDSYHQHFGYKVQVKDTVGAGDAFLAGLVSSLLDGEDSEQAISFACATGAYVASQRGGIPIYSKSDITKIINTEKKRIN